MSYEREEGKRINTDQLFPFMIRNFPNWKFVVNVIYLNSRLNCMSGVNGRDLPPNSKNPLVSLKSQAALPFYIICKVEYLLHEREEGKRINTDQLFPFMIRNFPNWKFVVYVGHLFELSAQLHERS